MKKIILAFVLLFLLNQTCFSADTSFIKTNQNKTTNYLANAADSNGKIIRWRKKIINVYIVPCSNDKQHTIISALNTYNGTFANFFKFKQVKKPEEADITIVFKKSINYGEIEPLGLTQLNISTVEKDTVYIKSAKIELLDSPTSNSAQLKLVTLHELGHAIGIYGHSLNKNDVMYPTTQGKNKFSSRDIETIKMIYKAGISANKYKNAMKDQEAKKAEMNLEKLIRDTRYSPYKYTVWTNLGDKYYSMKYYNQAIEAYKTALTKENAPVNAINKRISYCYTGLGNKTMAKKYMKLTQQNK